MEAPNLVRILLLAVVSALLTVACAGNEGVPQDITPASDTIAFGARTVDSDDQYGLYLVRPDGSELQELVNEPGFIFFPRWSPSGERLAYIVGTEGEESAGTLRVYDFRTGEATTVSEQALPSLHGPAMAWSPDGGRLAFSEDAGAGLLRIFDVDRDTYVDLPEVRGTTPDWSSSGDVLVYISSAVPGREGDLYVMEIDGENPRPLLERPGLEANPRWSPDGAQIAFWTAPAGRPEERALVVVSRDGETVNDLGSGFAAVWSPDGAGLAYSGPDPGNPANLEIYTLTLAQGVPRALSAAPSVALDSWPAWSPEGDRLAYVALVDQQTAFLCVAQVEPRDADCLGLPDELIPSAPAWR